MRLFWSTQRLKHQCSSFRQVHTRENVRVVRLWLVKCLHPPSLAWKSQFCAREILKQNKKTEWIFCHQCQSCHRCHKFESADDHQLSHDEPYLTEHATGLTVLSLICAQFFGLLEMLLLTLPISVLDGNVGIENLSGSNDLLFCLTKFCNDFFTVRTFARRCCIALVQQASRQKKGSSDARVFMSKQVSSVQAISISDVR